MYQSPKASSSGVDARVSVLARDLVGLAGAAPHSVADELDHERIPARCCDHRVERFVCDGASGVTDRLLECSPYCRRLDRVEWVAVGAAKERQQLIAEDLVDRGGQCGCGERELALLAYRVLCDGSEFAQLEGLREATAGE